MTERVLNIKNGNNFRELGGYQSKNGQHIRYHKLVRAGHLCDLSEADQNFLTEYGIRKDVDFRSEDEVTKGPDRIPSQIDYIFNPIFATDETQSTKSAAERDAEDDLMNKDPHAGYRQMVKVYHNLITDDHAQKAYQQFFALLLSNKQDDALLFHCTGGKDRTGMGAYFFLNALDIDEETIHTDYLMTNKVIENHLEEFMTSLREDGHTKASIENNRSFWSVYDGYLDQAQQDIREMSGNVHNYLKDELKLTKGDLADLRKLYLID